MTVDEIEIQLRECLAETLDVAQRAENGENREVLIAEIDSLYEAVDTAIEAWFARKKQITEVKGE